MLPSRGSRSHFALGELSGPGLQRSGEPVQPPPPPSPRPQLEQIRRDIRDFRSSAGLDKVIVLWTANTERFCEVVPGLNDTAENLLRTIQVGAPKGWGRPRASPRGLLCADCSLLPAAGPGSVALHPLCRGQHLGGLRLPQWVPTEHAGAWCPRACMAAPCLCGWRRLQVGADQGQVRARGLPYWLWPQGVWAWGAAQLSMGEAWTPRGGLVCCGACSCRGSPCPRRPCPS